MLNKVIFHVNLSTWSVNLVPTTHKGLELGLNRNMALYVEIKLRSLLYAIKKIRQTLWWYICKDIYSSTTKAQLIIKQHWLLFSLFTSLYRTRAFVFRLLNKILLLLKQQAVYWLEAEFTQKKKNVVFPFQNEDNKIYRKPVARKFVKVL